MDKCEWCGGDFDEFGMIIMSFAEDDPSHTICRDCYNKFVADMFGIENFRDYEKEVTFTDCDGIEHCFKIGKRIEPIGIHWEAAEFIDTNKIGYSFAVHQGLEEDPNDAIKRLYKKIRKGLSRKFIKREVVFGQEIVSFKGETVEGRIGWDENYDRIPKFIIDGRNTAWRNLAKW